MSTTVQDHVHEMARVRLRVASLVALLAAGVTAVTAVWVWNGQAEQRAILRLPEGARRALYERTLQTLQSSCKLDEGVGDLDDFCRSQAEFITKFPECDPSCSAVAKLYRDRPTR